MTGQEALGASIVWARTGLDQEDTGPTSDSVRLESQADCFGGAWAEAASAIADESATPFLEPISRSLMRSM